MIKKFKGMKLRKKINQASTTKITKVTASKYIKKTIHLQIIAN